MSSVPSDSLVLYNLPLHFPQLPFRWIQVFLFWNTVVLCAYERIQMEYAQNDLRSPSPARRSIVVFTNNLVTSLTWNE